MRVGSLYCCLATLVLSLTVPTSRAAAQTPDDDRLPSRPLPLMFGEPLNEPPVLILSEEDIAAAEKWANDFAAWQTWAERWLGRRQPGFWNNYLDRQEKPDPPAWLNDACGLLAGEDPFVQPCDLLARWREDPLVTQARQASTAAVVQKEAPTKTAWWQHVHIDGLWSTTQSNMSAFGLFGAHATIDVVGRLQTFVTPGILLVSVPSLYGNREMMPATDWGISYRLFHVGRNTVHFNLVRAWALGNRASLLRPNMMLAGFSVSFRRTDAARSRP